MKLEEIDLTTILSTHMHRAFPGGTALSFVLAYLVSQRQEVRA